MPAATIYNQLEWMNEREAFKYFMGDQLNTYENRHLAGFQMRRLVLNSAVFFIRNYCYTVDQETKLDVRCDPYIGQTLLDKAIEQQRRANIKQRVVEIKPRKVGWTTWNLGRALWASLHPNTNVLLVIDDDRVVQNVSIQLDQFLRNLPGWMTPKARLQNMRQLLFENPNPKLRSIDPGLNSSLTITVPAELRGVRAPNVVIFSEYAHYDDPADVMTSLLHGIGDHANTCIIIDTTPRGFDPHYHPMVEDAVRRNPNLVKLWERRTIPTREEVVNTAFGMADDIKDYIPVFCPWFWHEAYTTKDESSLGFLPKMDRQELEWMHDTVGKLRDYGGEEETELQERFGVSLYRLFWRRTRIKGQKGSDWRRKLLMFRQEMASTWDGCFVDFGETALDPEGMDVLRNKLREPLGVGLFADVKGEDGATRPAFKKYSNIFLRRSQWEEVRIYAGAYPGERFIAGVDTATAFESEKADYSASNVWRVLKFDQSSGRFKRDLKQVCVYHAKCPPHLLVDQISKQYHFYNQMLLAIETKGIGYPMCRTLMDPPHNCTNQYRYKRLDKDIIEVNSQWLGWESNFRTRPVAEEALVTAVAHRIPDLDHPGEFIPEPLIEMVDKLTFKEYQNLKRYTPGGGGLGYIAARGGHDDLADADMIALAVYQEGESNYRENRPAQEKRQLNALFERLKAGFGRIKDRNRPTLQEL